MCSFVQNQKLYTMDHSSQKAKRFRRIEEKFDRDNLLATPVNCATIPQAIVVVDSRETSCQFFVNNPESDPQFGRYLKSSAWIPHATGHSAANITDRFQATKSRGRLMTHLKGRFLLAALMAVSVLTASAVSWQPQPQTQNKDGGVSQQETASISDEKKSAAKPSDHETGKVVPQGDQKLQLATQLVNVVVTVTDYYGRFVTGLNKDHFDVFDDKVKQQIAHFSDEDSPVSLGIVYDVSGSMKDRIVRSMHALKRFVETSHDDDDFFLIGFNDRANLIQDFTNSADRLLGHLMFVQAKGSTALYDAAYLAVEKAKQGRHNKKALLIISDGQDNNSRYTYRELRNLVKEADVQIYAIGITDPGNDGLAGMGRSILEEIARMTGGRAFFPSAYNEAELIEICTRIDLEFRHQYAIGFYPTDVESDTKWHKVHVAVNPPKGLGHLSLSFKEGYQTFKK